MDRRFLLALALLAGPAGASQAPAQGTPPAAATAAAAAEHAQLQLAMGPAASLQAATARSRPEPAAPPKEDGAPGWAGRLLAALALMAAIALRRWMPGAS